MNPIDVLRDLLDFSTFYPANHFWLDGLLYLVLFTGLASATLGKTFKDRGGRVMIAAVGVALAIGASTGAAALGFRLGDLGPVAWVLLTLVLAGLTYRLCRTLGVPVLIAFSTAVFVATLTLASIGDPAVHLPTTLGLTAIITPLLGIALFALVIWIATRSVGKGPSSASPPSTFSPAITALDREVRSGTPNAASDGLLLGMGQQAHALDAQYEATLRSLASKGWKADPGKTRLAREVRTLLRAAREVLSRFTHTLKVAQSAHDVGNTALLREAVGRLRALDAEAVRLNRKLSELRGSLGAPAGTSRPTPLTPEVRAGGPR